jgi:ribosomal protein L12E/L44/L45/RPP1/RPP2
MPNAKGLPVDPERLRAEFPALTDDDLEAYVAVTRKILAAATPEERARITRESLASGRAAREKQAAGTALTEKEQRAVRYVSALDKMQSHRH